MSTASPPVSSPIAPAHSRLRALSLGQLALLAVLAAAIFPFLATLLFGYTYDDVGAIAEDARRHTLSALWGAWGQSYWGNPASGLYRPFAQFLFALFWIVGGGHALIFRLFVILLHVAATILVWIFLERALSRSAAFLGTILFAVDPVHVEAIGSIANSTEIMVTVLALAMVLVVQRAADRASPDVTIRWPHATLAAMLYLLALGAKESAGALPALALCAWWGWREPAAPAMDRERAPRFARTLWRGWRVWVASTVALAIAVSARAIVLGQLALDTAFVAPGIRAVSTTQRIWTMLAAWPLVGKLLFWPSKLAMFYGKDIIKPHATITLPAALALTVVALAAMAAIIMARRRDRRPLAALLWIAFAYFPASNLLVPTGQLLAERTLYLPSVGAVMLVAWLLERASAFVGRRAPAVRAQLVVAVPVALVALLGARKSAAAVLPWQDSYTLFVSGMEAMPKSARPYWLLGNWYANKGNQTRALAYLARAHRLDPTDLIVVYYYASALHKAGLHAMELSVLNDAVRNIPESQQLKVMFLNALGEQYGANAVLTAIHATPKDWLNPEWRARFLGEAYAEKGMVDSVRAVFRAILAREPDNGRLHYVFAEALRQDRAYDEAERELALAERDKAVAASEVLGLRAQLALARGDTVGARRMLAQAHAAAPSDTTITNMVQHFDSLTAHAPPAADPARPRS